MPKLYLAKTLPFLAASTVILSLLFVPLHAFANSKHSQYWYTMLRDQVLLPNARILKTFCVLRHAKQSLFMIIISYGSWTIASISSTCRRFFDLCVASSSVLGANFYIKGTVYIIFTRSHYNCINTPTTTHYKYVFHYPYQNGRWKSRLDNLLTFVEDVFEYYWDESSGVKVLRWVWRPLWVHDDKKCRDVAVSRYMMTKSCVCVL